MRELAGDIERLNLRIARIDGEAGALLERHGNPFADLHGAGPTVALTLIAQAGDVRRFAGPAAFARYSGRPRSPAGQDRPRSGIACTAAATAS